MIITDINECDDASSNCDQICNNTIGGFECECYPGYSFNDTTSSCQQSKTFVKEKHIVFVIHYQCIVTNASQILRIPLKL